MTTLETKPKFNVGDRVTFINDYGCEWPDKTITEIIPNTLGEIPTGWRYYYAPTDAPWFAVREDQIVAEAAR